MKSSPLFSVGGVGQWLQMMHKFAKTGMMYWYGELLITKIHNGLGALSKTIGGEVTRLFEAKIETKRLVCVWGGSLSHCYAHAPNCKGKSQIGVMMLLFR